jgi:hypothetical protein
LGDADEELVSSGLADEADPRTRGDPMFLDSSSGDDETRQSAAAVAAASRLEAANESKFFKDLANAIRGGNREKVKPRAKKAKVRSSRCTHLWTSLMD